MTPPRATLFLLIAVALWALFFQLTLPARLPSEDDHRAAAELINREALPSDVVLLFPWWNERARLFIRGPDVVGYLGSDHADLEEHPRIWVLSQPDLPRADVRRFAEAFAPGRTTVGEPHRFGRLRVQLFQNARHRPRAFSAVDALSEAQVSVNSAAGTVQACAFDGRTHHCGLGGGGVQVAAGTTELFYRPVRCLRSGVPGGARRVQLRFPSVPHGSRLVMRAGIAGELAARHGGRLTPLHVELRDGQGQQLAALEIPPGFEGAREASVKVPNAPLDGLSVHLWSENPEARAACIELFMEAERAG